MADKTFVQHHTVIRIVKKRMKISEICQGESALVFQELCGMQKFS